MIGGGFSALLAAFLLAGSAVPAEAQAPRRKIGELRLSLLGISAGVDPANPVVPKNTPAGVRVVVRAGTGELSLADVVGLFGPGFTLEAEISGPGLPRAITLPVEQPGSPLPPDPLVLPLPPLSVAGDYPLTNIRLVSNGAPVLEVTPPQVVVQVIDQILVTSVKTRPLTLDEIRERGIDVNAADNLLGFAFTLGLRLDSKAVSITLPVVFDRKGAVIPEPLRPPPPPPRLGDVQLPPLPTIVPLLLEPVPEGDGGSGPDLSLPGLSDAGVRIPSVLVIPGNVGYLKQFFSAQLFVANGSPLGSNLVVRNVHGKIELPVGEDGVPGRDPNCLATSPPEDCPSDDPLALPPIVKDGQSVPHPEELPVLGLGPDATPLTGDDLEAFAPGEQGMADFTIRGDAEGYHPIAFDIRADLDGLPVGTVKLKGRASGGVLVRNPYFDLTFTAPSVVRTDETFTMFVTVTNIGQGTANLLKLSLEQDAISGLNLLSDGELQVDELKPGDAKTFEFEFLSQRTGQVIASYLRFGDAAPGGTQGNLKFKVGVGERGVPLSPDTLVLPSSVDTLPDDVVRAAMRVLGQAWSVANAPSGTLPRGVVRTDRSVVTAKALALAEAGLRVTLGQAEVDAVRDLAYDFWSGTPAPDPGFDQLLRTTEAGRNLAVAIGAALAETATGHGGGIVGYEQELSRLLTSGPDFLAFSVANGASGAPVDVTLWDGAARRTQSAALPGQLPLAEVPGALLLPLGPPSSAPLLGLVTAPTESMYMIELFALETGPVDVSVTRPRGDGTVLRGVLEGVLLQAGEKARIRLPRDQPDLLRLEHDLPGPDGFPDGIPDSAEDLLVDPVVQYPEGPLFKAARVIGPETLAGASPLGVYAAFLFDRVVDEVSAADERNYTIPSNDVVSARRQLSGRLVFASLAQPEGNYVPTTVTVSGMADGRGVVRFSPETHDLVSLVPDPGAIVTGRVINADGTPVPAAVVTYLNNKNFGCIGGAVEAGIAALPVASSGAFEFRFVRQDACGAPFALVTQDPTTGAVRRVTGYVRTAGERINLDIALFGKGSVTGQVRRIETLSPLTTEPAPGIQVSVLSVTDPQSSGAALTDGDGRYQVDGITVGPVSVRAGGSSGLGRGSGRIERPGTPAVVDILLDDNAARVHGTVYKVEGGATTAIPGIQVLYYAGPTLLAATVTDDLGAYAIEGVPVGDFAVTAALNQRDGGRFDGRAEIGDDVKADIVIEVPPDSELGTLRGSVHHASGEPADGVLVSTGSRAAVTAGEPVLPGDPPRGSFEILGVPLKPFQTQTALARHPDGRRTGSRKFSFGDRLPGEPPPVANVVITLSGVGEAHFLVKDAAGNPIPNQEVLLQGLCLNPCGCAAARTGPGDQPAVFRDVPVGGVFVRAFRSGLGFTDVASGSVTIAHDGDTPLGILQFRGGGRVSGKVLEPAPVPSQPPVPAHGAEVVLQSRVFFNDGQLTCDLVPGVSHRVRTGQDGTYDFDGVPVGSVKVTATHPFNSKTIGAQGNLAQHGAHVVLPDLVFVDTIAGILDGIVLLPDGETPAGKGIEVTASGPLPDITVKTNAAGRYQFPEILPEGGWTLLARDPQTGLVAREKIFLRAGEPATHDLRLEGRGRVLVRVVDGADDPVPQALVRLKETDFPGGSYDAVLDPSKDGVVTFESVFEGGLSVEVSDPLGRGGRASGTLPRAGDTIEIKVPLTTTGTVTGVFRMPATPEGPGAAIPYGIVQLVSGGRVIGQTTTEGSGDVGRFTFSYVPAGPFRLEAQDPLTARTGFNVGTLTTEKEVVERDVVAQALGSVLGTVTQNGLGVSRAHVDVVSGSFKACTFADTGGDYRLDGVPEGLVTVTASLTGGAFSGTNAKNLTTEGEELRIDVALRSSGRVEGTVVAAGGGAAPLSVVSVQVGGKGGGRQATTTDGTGRFTFESVPAGLAQFEVDAVGTIDRARKSAEVPAADTLDVTIELNGTGSIAGDVFDVPDGYEADVIIQGTGDFPYQFWLKPDTAGHFRVPEVLAGPFTATLRAFGALRLYGSLSDVLLPGEAKSIALHVQPTGELLGTVYRSGPEQKPAFGANVRVTTISGVLTAQVGPAGQFLLDGVPAGEVSVRVEDPVTGGIGVGGGTVPADGRLTLDPIVLDDTPVTVLTVSPPDGTIGVAVDQVVVVTFSDELASASGVSAKLGPSTVSLSPVLEADRRTVTLRPNAGGWPDARELTVTATTAVTDVLGRHMLQTFTSRFRTVDLSPPKVASVFPASNAVQVDPAAAVTVTFDEPLSLATDLAAVVALSRSGVPVPGTAQFVEPGTTAVRFDPEEDLPADARYTVTVNGAEDESGNRQTVAFTSTFRTLDTLPPVLTLVAPADGAWVKTARPAFHVGLSDGPFGLGADPATAKLFVDEPEVAAAKSAGAITWTPPADLAEGTHAFRAEVRDHAGNLGTLGVPQPLTVRIDTALPEPVPILGVDPGVVSGVLHLQSDATDVGSGVAKVEFLRDGVLMVAATASPFSADFNTAGLADGAYSLTARAVDVAGNVGPAGPPVPVVVDNHPLTVSITSPADLARFRDAVVVRVVVSEPVDRVEVSLEPQTVAAALVATRTYQTTLDLAAVPEGVRRITATAHGLAGETVPAVVDVVVDRTPPAAPDPSRISAEPPAGGVSLVFGRAGAVETTSHVVRVEIRNTRTGALAVATPAANGSFSASLAAEVDDELALVAVDDLGNASAAATVVVRRTPSLPPSEGNTSLRFEGTVADRVGPGAAALAPDGSPDAVFTLSLSIGEGITRQLSFVDLARTSGAAMTRSTRPAVGSVLGVDSDAADPLLNGPDGQVGFPVTTGATLVLYAADGGFVQPGASYMATAGFTDGSRFVGLVTIEAPEDQAQVAHSARIVAEPPTVQVAPGAPGTAVLTLTDILDIEGTRVPDGARVALAVADMAARDPRGNPIRSAGGAIEGGEPAANNASFQVFTVLGGTVTATYSSGVVTAEPALGAHAVVQILAADAAGNVLGTEVIATADLDLRSASDLAVVEAAAPSFYADKGDRRTSFSVSVRDASGNPVPDGTVVVVSAGHQRSVTPNGCCFISSAGGQVLGGAASPSGAAYRAFTTAGGRVDGEYSAEGLFVPAGQTAVAVLQVLSGLPSGAFASNRVIGTGTVTLTGASAAEVRLGAESVALVAPPKLVPVLVHHVHDTRGNLVPDGANLLISARHQASVTFDGCCHVSSVGGRIVDGTPSPTGLGFQFFPLSQGEVVATYSTEGVSLNPGASGTASLQIAMGDPAGVRLENRNIAVRTITVAAPANAVGAAEPPRLLADGAPHPSTVRFDPVLDAFGNPLPDGSRVVATVKHQAAVTLDGSQHISSDGGDIEDGEPSPSGANYRAFTVADGAVTVTYASRDVTALPGQIKTARVSLLSANASGAYTTNRALGTVAISLAGLSSATGTASPGTLHADGADHRSVVTLSAIRDANGEPAPEGTLLAVSAKHQAAVTPDGTQHISSAGGVIVGGAPAVNNASFRVFTVTNGQVVFEYSSQGVAAPTGGQLTATVQVVSATPEGALFTNRVTATVAIPLLGPAQATVTASPTDLFADGGARLSQIVLTDLFDTGGVPIPDGAKVGLSVKHQASVQGCCHVSSAGGEVLTAGTTPGDGTVSPNNSKFHSFTVAGGEVRAVYSAAGLAPGVGETLVARVQVVPAAADTGNVVNTNAFAVGIVNLRGMTSAMASGPATLSRTGEPGTVTFSGIKDSAGNTVPDGTRVVVTAAHNATVTDTGCCHNGSTGGTITDGGPSPSGAHFRVFTVEGGSVTVTYSAATAGVGTARIQLAPARPDGSIISNRSLSGGVWAVTVTN